jgi:hypothetical protein
MSDALNLLDAYLNQQQHGATPHAADPAAFVAQFAPTAARVGARLGVDPSVLLGQWGLETGWGRSIIPGTNNLGNIKDFSGRGVAARDNATDSVDRYRQFDSADEFGDHYADLLERMYPGALNAGSDAARFAQGLQGGQRRYAEDPAYASKVVAAARDVAGRLGTAAPAEGAQPDQPAGYDPYADILNAGLAATRLPTPAPAQAGVMRTLGDVGIKLAQGAVDLGQSVVGLGSLATGGLVGKAARAVGYDPEATNQFLGQYLSPSQQAAEQAVQNSDGMVDAIVQSLTHPRSILGGAAESLPGMLGGMGLTAAVARGIGLKAALATTEGALARDLALQAGKNEAQAAAAALSTMAGKRAAADAIDAASARLMAIGSASEGAQSAGQIADQAQGQGRSWGQYVLPALAAGTATAGIGYGAGRLMGDVGTDIATGSHTVKGGLPARLAKEAFSEGVLEEAPQSAQEQFFTNVATGEPDLMKGVGQQAGVGGVVGAAMGAGMGMVHRPAGPLTRAAQAAGANVPAATTPDSQPAAAAPAAPSPEAQPAAQQPLAEAAATAAQAVPPAAQNIPATLGEALATAPDAAPAPDMPDHGLPQLAATARHAAEVEGLQQQSAHESLNANLPASQANATQRARMAVLDGVLERLPPDTPPERKLAAFSAQLKREGYRFTAPTPDEMEYVATHARVADAYTRTEQEYAAPNELVDAVPERKAPVPPPRKKAAPAPLLPPELLPAAQEAKDATAFWKALNRAGIPQGQRAPLMEGFKAFVKNGRKQQGGTNATALPENPAAAGTGSDQPVAGHGADDTARPGVAGPALAEQPGAAAASGEADATDPVRAGGGSDAEPALNAQQLDGEWHAFPPESGTLGIERADMPQIKAEHRGALTQFLKARGITHEQESVLPSSLKATQREFSIDKVDRAKNFQEGDRAILVSSDDHILDGHHQWLAALEHDTPIRVIRFNAPIRELLPEAAQFPSAELEEGAQAAPEGEAPHLSIGKTPNSAAPVTVRDGVVHIGAYPAQDFDSGADITVPDGATAQQIKDALVKGGAIGHGNKIFGMPKEAEAAKVPEVAPTASPAEQFQGIMGDLEKGSAAERARAEWEKSPDDSPPPPLPFPAAQTEAVTETAPPQSAAVEAPALDAAADDLDEQIRAAGAHLIDVLTDITGSKLKATGPQYTAGDLLPALSKLIGLLIQKGARSFAQAVAGTARALRGLPGGAEAVDKISARQWKAGYNAVADYHEGTDSEAAVAAMPADEVLRLVQPAASSAAPKRPINPDPQALELAREVLNGRFMADHKDKNEVIRLARERGIPPEHLAFGPDAATAKLVVDEVADRNLHAAPAEAIERKIKKLRAEVDESLSHSVATFDPTRLGGSGAAGRQRDRAHASERRNLTSALADRLQRELDQRTAPATSGPSAPADELELTTQQLNRKSVKDMTDAELRRAQQELPKRAEPVAKEIERRRLLLQAAAQSKVDEVIDRGRKMVAEKVATDLAAWAKSENGEDGFALRDYKLRDYAFVRPEQAQETAAEFRANPQLYAKLANVQPEDIARFADVIAQQLEAGTKPERPKNIGANDEYHGFGADLPPMQRSRAQKALGQYLRFDGVMRTRKAEMERRVAEGARIEPHDRDGRRLFNPRGAFLPEGAIGKTAMDYAAHLIAQRGQQQAAAAQPQEPASPVHLEGSSEYENLRQREAVNDKAVDQLNDEQVERLFKAMNLAGGKQGIEWKRNAIKAEHPDDVEAGLQALADDDVVRAHFGTPAEHVESGQSEPATLAVIGQSLAKEAAHTPINYKTAKANLLAAIDAAIATAPQKDTVTNGQETELHAAAAELDKAREALRVGKGDRAQLLAAVRRAEQRSVDARKAAHYLEFDVPGDGKFSVLNSREKLSEFRKRVVESKGFDAPKRRSSGSASSRTLGVSENPAAAIRDMLEQGEKVAAYELAKTIGQPFRFTPNTAQGSTGPNLYMDARDIPDMPHGIQGYVGRRYGDKGKPWYFIEKNTGMHIGEPATSAVAAEKSARDKIKATNKDALANAIHRFASTVPDNAALEAAWLAAAEKSDDDYATKLEREAQAATRQREAQAERAQAEAEQRAREAAARAASPEGKIEAAGFTIRGTTMRVNDGNGVEVTYPGSQKIGQISKFDRLNDKYRAYVATERSESGTLEQAIAWLKDWYAKEAAAKAAKQPSNAAKIGDTVSIQGTDFVLFRQQVAGDGVLRQLFNGAKLADKRGAVRYADPDSGETIYIKVFPTFDAAERVFEEAPATEPPAEPAPRSGSVRSVDSLNALTNPLGDGDVVRLADGSEWTVRNRMKGWSLMQGQTEHPEVRDIPSQVGLIRAIIDADAEAEARMKAKATPAPTEKPYYIERGADGKYVLENDDHIEADGGQPRKFDTDYAALQWAEANGIPVYHVHARMARTQHETITAAKAEGRAAALAGKPKAPPGGYSRHRIKHDAWLAGYDSAAAEQSTAEATPPAEGGTDDRISPEQAKKQMAWRDLGQRDGVTTHKLFFNEDGEGDASGAISIASVQKIDGGKWELGGERFDGLRDAKKAAVEAGLQYLREQGYVAKEAAPAEAAQDVSDDWSNRLDQLAQVKKEPEAAPAAPVDLTARPALPPDESGYESLRARLQAYSEAFLRWVATLPDSTIENQGALVRKINSTPMREWVRIDNGDDHHQKSIDFLGPNRKLELREFAGGMSSNHSGYTVPGSGRDVAAILHNMVAQVEGGRRGETNHWAAERVAAERYKAGESVAAAIKALFAAPQQAAASEAAPQQEAAGVEARPAQSPVDTLGLMNVAEQERTEKALYDGELPLAALKANFKRLLASEQVIRDELNATKKDDLLKMGGVYFYHRHRNDNKPDIIKALYEQMLHQYTLNESISYVMGRDSYRSAMEKVVDALTPEKLAAFREKVIASRKEARAEAEQHVAALTDPQTADDFDTLARSQMAEYQKEHPDATNAAAFLHARLSMTPEQRARYDELKADAARADRASRKVEKQDQALRVPGEPLRATETIKTKHGKYGHDLWQFQIEQRVSTEEYKRLSDAARRLGGDYSSYRGNGAIPGWQFKTPEGAEAFKKLIAGDDSAAREVAQARRDAFDDDRSQSTVERLREMAERLDEQASESEGRERKTNTARRAGFAAAADAAARRQRAMAETMRNLAAGIEAGTVKFLDRVRAMTQIDLLNTLAEKARDKAADAEFPLAEDKQRRTWSRPHGYDKRLEVKPTVSDMDHAEFPSYTAYRSDLATLGRQLLEVDGTKKLGEKIMKVADDVTAAYLKFAKENLHRVSTYTKRRGPDGKDEPAVFENKISAERAIAASNLSGKAIVLPFKRGQNIIVMSPSEAIEHAIWKGDGDKKITLHPDFGAELVERLARVNRRQQRVSVPWTFDTAYERRKALARMNIESPAELRAALREYLGLKVAPKEADRVKELERQMVGRRNDGLDFFPTPADQADDMIAVAELEAGMRVLEPSAGMGHIADRIREAGVEPDVMEISPERRELLEAKGYELVGNDFMDMKAAPRGYTFGDLMEAPDGVRGIVRGKGGMGSDRVRLVDPADPTRNLGFYNFSELQGIEYRGVQSGYDRIIMNPPFSNRRDAEHVMHAYSLLKPGGRLVAIMGEGVFFGQDKMAQAFRDWLAERGGTSEKLAEGTFNDPSLPVNTGVNARMVVIDKPADAAQVADTMYSKAVPDETRRKLLVAAAAAAIAPNASAADVALGKAKPLDPKLLGQRVLPGVEKVLRDGQSSGTTSLNGIKVLHQAMKLIALSGPKELRPLAAQIDKLLPTSGTVMVTVDDTRHMNVHGAVELEPFVHLRLFTAQGHRGMTYETVLHEALHVAVAARYRSLSVGMVRGNDKVIGMAAPQAAKALAQFEAVWDEFRSAVAAEQFANKELGLAVDEARANPDEFFVRALTDPLLQAYMAGKRYEGRTLWERFKDWVKTFLFGMVETGGTAPSWLDAALAASGDVAEAMGQDRADFKRLAAINNYEPPKAQNSRRVQDEGETKPIAELRFHQLDDGKYRVVGVGSDREVVLANNYDEAGLARALGDDLAARIVRENAGQIDGLNVRAKIGAAEPPPPEPPTPSAPRGPVFYSALARTIPDMAKIANKDGMVSPEQARAWLAARQKEGKFKAAELLWSGVEDWLKLQPGKIKVDDIARFVDENGVQVQEVIKGERGPDTAGPAADREDRDAVLEELGEEYGQFLEENGLPELSADELLLHPSLTPEQRDWLRDFSERWESAEWGDSEPSEQRPDDPKYATYTMRGGENYRELLLTLPSEHVEIREDLIDYLQQQMRDAGYPGLAGEERRVLREGGPDAIGMLEDYRDRLGLNVNDVLAASRSSGYFSGHWDEPNVVAHVRFNDRTDADGKRVLFIEELQSDWAQEGKKEGFAARHTRALTREQLEERGVEFVHNRGKWQANFEDGQIAEADTLSEAVRQVNEDTDPDFINWLRGGVPSGPFVTDTKAWVTLALKRIIRYAAEHGHDRIAFINGQQSTERYDLARKINEVAYNKQTQFLRVLSKGGKEVFNDVLPQSELADFLGREVADKIAAGGSFVQLTGLDLQLGGEGMHAFYDRIVPQAANELLKKLGAGKMGTVDMRPPDTFEDGQLVYGKDQQDALYTRQPGFDITPALREEALTGLPLFNQAHAPVFYSALARTVPAMAKIATKDGLVSPAQARAWLAARQKEGKFKADELQWSGLDDWLKLQPGKVAVDDIARFVAENGVQVKETLYQASQEGTQTIDALSSRYPDEVAQLRAAGFKPVIEANADGDDQLYFYHADNDHYIDSPLELRQIYGADRQTVDAAQALSNAFASSVSKYQNATRYDNYTLPGGTNYHELLLSLPRKVTPPTAAEVARVQAGRAAIFAQYQPRLDELIKQAEAEQQAGDLVASRALYGEYSSLMAARDQRAAREVGEMPLPRTEPVRYTTGHWDVDNVIAHVRFNDRTDADGKRVLFVEELQSDWGQSGAKDGFTGPEGYAPGGLTAAPWDASQPWGWWRVRDGQGNFVINIDPRELYHRLGRTFDQPMTEALAVQDAERQLRLGHRPSGEKNTTPRGPFVTDTKAWLSLALKRVIRYAAEHGYDRVAFINGEQSAERYDLSKHVDELTWRVADIGGYMLHIKDVTGKITNIRVEDDKELVNTVGKELAERITEYAKAGLESGRMQGLDLKVGGEGMRKFYDQIVPQTANELLKKLGGGKVEPVQMGGDQWRVVETDGGSFVAVGTKAGEEKRFGTRAAADQFVERQRRDTMLKQPGFDITPALRERALAGLPLFDRKASSAMPGASDFDRKLYALVQHGSSGYELLNRIVRESANPDYRALAERLLALHVDPVVELGAPITAADFATSEDVNGATYYPGEHRIELHEPYDTERHLLHELIHAATYQGLRAGGRAAQQMRALFAEVQRRNPTLAGYGMKNVDEFVAEAHSNPAFQARLRAMRDGQRSLWQRFVDIMRRIIGLPEAARDLLDKVLAVGRRVMAENARALGEAGEYAPGNRSAVPAGLIDVDGVQRPTTNSRGRPIAATPTAIRNFWRWFGESKAVDEQGRPLALYHGTPEQDVIDSFRPAEGVDGLYFSDHPAVAQGYTGQRGLWLGRPTGAIYPAYVAMQNPLVIDALGRRYDNIPVPWQPWRPKVYGNLPKNAVSVMGALAYAIEHGHDGLIVRNVIDTVDRAGTTKSDVYAALRPEQVKSVIGNNGAFDPASLEILGNQGWRRPAKLEWERGDENNLDPALKGHLLESYLPDGSTLLLYHDADGATLSHVSEDGHDLLITDGTDAPAASLHFETPEQAKDAAQKVYERIVEDTNPFGAPPDMLGNQSARFGQAVAEAANNINNVRLPAGYVLGDFLRSHGKINWWHKTIGTMDNLARKHPAFALVYRRVQQFLNDVSRFANQAADAAPTLLPQLETWRDIVGRNRKKAVSAEDTRAIAAPIFEGTLLWTRDGAGRPVKLADLEDRAQTMSVADMARELIAAGEMTEEENRAWQTASAGLYNSTIRDKYGSAMLQAGIVFTPEELRGLFGLNEGQIGLYQEFRAAVDKSLTNLTITEMVRMGGKHADGTLEHLLDAPDLRTAASLLQAHFAALVRQDPENAPLYARTAQAVANVAKKGQRLMDKGYAPLMRFGRHTVYVTEDGQQMYFGMYENRADANKMARQMRELHPEARVTQGTLSEEEYKLFSDISPETLEMFGAILGLRDDEGDAADLAFQTFLKRARDNRSALKRLIHRKGVAGFSEDPGRVLAAFLYSNARRASANAHQGEVDEAINEIPQRQGELKDAAMRLRDHVWNPRKSTFLSGLMFAQFLGGSLASAAVNITQPLTMTLPFLSQYGGLKAASDELLRAVREASRDSTGDPELDKALQWAIDQGIVAPQEVHYLIAQAGGKATLRAGDGSKSGNAQAAAHNALTALRIAWGKPFEYAELMNRKVTFIAAWRTARREGIPNAERFAADAVNQTQMVYNSGNRPAWARSPIGGLLMTFKQYSVGYLELLARLAFAGQPGSPERAAGRRAALYMVAVLFLMAGADGLPFEQDVEDAIDGLLQRLGYNFSTKRAKQALLADVLGAGGADFVTKGLSALPGMPLDVAGRFGMGNLIPGTGLLKKKEDYTRDLGELAGPAGDLAKRAFTASGKALGGDLAGAALDLSPLAVRNMAQGADMLRTGSYNDQRGYKVNDTTPFEAVMKGVGFQPNSTADIQEAKGQALDLIAQTRMRSREIAERWAQGRANNDEQMVQEARDMRDEWNRKNPDTPIRVDMPAVIRRARAMRENAVARTQKTAGRGLKEAVRQQLSEVRE